MKIETVNKDKLVKVVEHMISSDVPLVSNLANLSKVLYDNFEGTCWCGFYICDDNSESMYLGPFQGPVACTKIPYAKGVCGACVREKNTMLVPNVHEFKDHIACYSLTNSEVVVPIIKDDKVVSVIDLDSTNYKNFTLNDVFILEQIASKISNLF